MDISTAEDTEVAETVNSQVTADEMKYKEGTWAFRYISNSILST